MIATVQNWWRLSLLAGLLAAGVAVASLSGRSAESRSGASRSAVERHPPPRPATPREIAGLRPPGARQAALRFLDGWLACVYLRVGCGRVPGMLPAFAKRLTPRLAEMPITIADLAGRPRFVSMRLVSECPHEAVAVTTYRLARSQLRVHPDLVREPGGWRVFGLPEAAVQMALPRALGSDQQC